MKTKNYKNKQKGEINKNSVYSTSEVAELLGVNSTTVLRLTKSGKMYCIRPKTHRMYLGQHLLDFLNEEKNKEAEKYYHRGFYEGLNIKTKPGKLEDQND